MGNSVRCLDHFLTLIARSLRSLAQHIENTLGARLNGNDNLDSGNLSQRMVITSVPSNQWDRRGQGESFDVVDKSFHVDTITDGDESDTLT